MNILHICSYYENVLFEKLVQSLSKCSCENEVYVFYPLERKDEPFYNDKEKVTVSYCYKKFDRCFFHRKHNKVINDFYRLYSHRIKKFNIMYAHSLFSNGYVAYKAKKMWNIPYVVMIQNTDLNVFLKYMKHLNKLGLSILEESSAIICASQSYANELMNKYIPEKLIDQIKKKIHIIPYGIDDFYYNNEIEKNYICKKKSEICILSVGTICKNKNHIMLAEAVKKFRNVSSYDNVFLTIIGKAENRNIVGKLKSYDFVRYIDFLDKEELIKYYRKADIFALVSTTETFGLVYAEALSQGCPILYSKGQGFDKQFEEGKVGYHANSDDIDDIVAKLGYILENRYDRNTCIELSYKYRWSNVSKLYLKLFSDILV